MKAVTCVCKAASGRSGQMCCFFSIQQILKAHGVYHTTNSSGVWHVHVRLMTNHQIFCRCLWVRNAERFCACFRWTTSSISHKIKISSSCGAVMYSCGVLTLHRKLRVLFWSRLWKVGNEKICTIWFSYESYYCWSAGVKYTMGNLYSVYLLPLFVCDVRCYVFISLTTCRALLRKVYRITACGPFFIFSDIILIINLHTFFW